jgi:acetyl-CoA carboxylase carboxyl transferase subunit alpha
MPTLAAEERGQALAIAENIKEMSRLKTPIIIVVIGEAGSGGALAVAVGDSIAMLEHSYYSVISPEGCASILWKDSSKKELAAQTLKLNAENIIELGIVDEIIKEPLGGAHNDKTMIYSSVKEYVVDSWDKLKALPYDMLIERRYLKFRGMGKFRTIDQ